MPHVILLLYIVFPGGSVVKNPPAKAGEAGSVLELGRSPGEGNGNLPQYSCLGNSMDRGAWQGYSPRGHTESDRVTENVCNRL